MTTETLLAKLSPKSSTWDSGAHDTSGQTITPQDVAASLAGCSGLACSVAWFKYASGTHHDIWKAYRDRLIRTAVRWANKDKAQYQPGFLRKILELAIVDCLLSRLCRTCNGRKQIQTNEGIIKCRVCGGRGEISIRESDRYRRLGVTNRDWRNKWSWRYGKVCSDLLRADGEAMTRVAKRCA